MYKQIIMKNIKQYLVLMLFTISLFSCEKFLDQELHQAVDSEDAINNLNDAQVALNGCYDGLQEIELFSRDLYVIADLAADNSRMNAQNAGRFISIYQWNYTVSDQWITGVWNYGYQTLYRVNKLLLDVAALEDVDEADQDRIMGEAKVIRALVYFELVNFFGQTYSYEGSAGFVHYGVPLLTEPVGVDEDPGRATVQEIYNQILLDLEGNAETSGAIDLLGNGSSPFYIDISAAHALLSRVYLYMVNPDNPSESASNLQKARDYALQVINSGKYDLVSQTDFQDAWFLRTGQEDNPEQIFYLHYSEVDNWSVDMMSAIYMESGYGDILATDDLISLYDASDVRLVWFRESGGLNFIEKFPGKRDDYVTPENEVNVNINNHPVFRLAEMYLNAAEAEVLLGNDAEAQVLVNEITSRAGANPALETGSALLEKIKLERRKELCFEGHRLWDLQRWHENIVRTDLTSPNIISLIEYPNYLFAYPIPDREIQANLVIAEQQNPGY